MASTSTTIVNTIFKANDQATKTISGIGKVASVAKTALVSLGLALSAGTLVNSFKEAVKVGAEFEQSMVNAGAKFGGVIKGTEAFEAMQVKAREVGASTEFMASEVAQAFEYMAMSGMNVNVAIASMNGLVDIATAGNLDLGRATDIASDMMSMFAIDIQRVGDVMSLAANSSNTSMEMMYESFKMVGPSARQAGMSIETTSAMLEMLADSGIKGSNAGTALAGMLRNVLTPAKKGADALDALGVSAYNARGEQRAMVDIIDDIARATVNLSDAEKNQYISDIFDVRGVKAYNILTTASKEVNSVTHEGINLLRVLNSELDHASGSAAKTAAIMRSTVGNQFKVIASLKDDLRLNFFDAFNPVLVKILNKIVIALQQAQPLFTALGKALGQIALALNHVIKSLLWFNQLTQGVIPLIFSVVMAFKAVNIVMAIFNTIMLANPLGLILVAVVALISALYWLASNWDKVKEAMLGFMRGAGQAITSFVAKAIKGFKKIASFLWANIFSNKFVQAAILIFVPWLRLPVTLIQYWTPIKAFFSNLFSSIKSGLTSFVMSIYEKVKPVGQFLKELWGGIKEAFTEAWIGIKELFSQFSGYIYNTVIKPVDNFFKELWDNIFGGAKKAFGSVMSFMNKAADFVINPYAAVKKDAFSIKSNESVGKNSPTMQAQATRYEESKTVTNNNRLSIDINDPMKNSKVSFTGAMPVSLNRGKAS